MCTHPGWKVVKYYTPATRGGNMIRLRWLERVKAFLGGRFWLPCPVCDRYFSGYEAEFSEFSLMPNEYSGHSVCPYHTEVELYRLHLEVGWRFRGVPKSWEGYKWEPVVHEMAAAPVETFKT